MSKKRKKINFPLKGVKLLTSQRAAREITSRFHKTHANRKIYQDASILLTNLNKSCAKFVFKTITDLGLRPERGDAPLKLLEIGAINTQLINCNWLDVLAIDKKSRHPRIKEIDFFNLEENNSTFDVVCNAMVLNCINLPIKRGLMILKCQRLLKMNGLFVLSVPRRSLHADKVGSLFLKFGFELVTYHVSKKILYISFIKISKNINVKAIQRHQSIGPLQILLEDTNP